MSDTLFQCWNDGGSFQVDGTNPQMVYRRKVTLTLSTMIGNTDSGNKPYFYAETQLDTNELVAIGGYEYAFPIYRNGSVVRIASPVANAQVLVYIFGPIANVAASSCFQAWDAQSKLIFDAAQKPIRMTAFTSNEGDFYYQNNRRYAAVVSTNWLKVATTFGNNGNFETQRDVINAGMTKEINYGISVQNLLLSDQNIVLENVGGVDRTLNPNSINQHIIVDVTNY